MNFEAFDDNALEHHQKKYLCTIGISCGLRANKEHAELHAREFYFDSYVPHDDPKRREINGHIRKKGCVDKTLKLTTSNTCTRDETECLPIPVGYFNGMVVLHVFFVCLTASSICSTDMNMALFARDVSWTKTILFLLSYSKSKSGILSDWKASFMCESEQAHWSLCNF